VVVDEAHHSPARCWQRVLEHFRPDFLLGCTATPERLDGQSVEKTLGKTLYSYGLSEAMEDCYLVPIRQHGIRTEVSLAEVTARMGDFSKEKLSAAVRTEARTQTAVEAYLRYAPERPALVFAVDLEHVEMLRQAFVMAGIKTAAITGKTSKKERRRILEEFRDGHYQVLVGCEVLTEGYDERRISCVVMARPTQSKALYQQCVGRGLRIDPGTGKADCLVLDLIDYGCRHRVMAASDLFGAHVPDCGGLDIREAVREEKARWKREPVVPKPSLRARWELGEETPWGELPTLRGYVPRYLSHHDDATDKQLHKITRSFGFEVLWPLTKGEASHLIDECIRLDALYPTPATEKQEAMLRYHGLLRPGMSKREAKRAIVELKQGVN
jgi:type I site-specific restriction endonuclease